MVLWHHGVFGRIEPPTTTDFVSFYAAGKLALAGSPALAYDQAAHAAAEVAATVPGIGTNTFSIRRYTFWCAPLALLPYMAALYCFRQSTLAAWLLVMRRILRMRAGPGASPCWHTRRCSGPWGSARILSSPRRCSAG